MSGVEPSRRAGPPGEPVSIVSSRGPSARSGRSAAGAARYVLIVALAVLLSLGGVGVSVSHSAPSSSTLAQPRSDTTPAPTPPPEANCGFFTASLSIVSPVPAAGPAGTHFTLEGNGFYAPGPTPYLIQIWLATASGTNLGTVAFVNEGTEEPFTLNLDMPGTGTEGGLTLGTYYLWGLNATSPSNCAETSFTLTGVNPGLACESWVSNLSVVSPTPALGGAGTTVQLQGSGFYHLNVTYIYWAMANGGLLTYLLPVTTSATGWFNVSTAVPSGSTPGTYFFWATDGTSNYDCAGAQFNVTAVPVLGLTPESGPGGTTVAVTGTGFAASDTGVTITGDVLLFPLSCSASAGSITGACSFQVDGGLAGPQTITGVGNVVGGAEDTGSATFTVFPNITLSPDEGLAGSSFTATGYDFSAYPSAADVTFDGELLTPTGGSDCAAGDTDTLITLDAEGSFVCTFTVPSWATPGANEVQGNDTFTDEATAVQTFAEVGPLAITTSQLRAWDAGWPGYAETLSATGGLTPYTWSATGLPSGLNLDPSTGAITGTPTSPSPSIYSVTVTVTDADENVADQTYSLQINAPPVITTTSLRSWDAGLAGYVQPVVLTGGTAPETWDVIGLPSGLSFNPDNEEITGTPSTSTGSPFSVEVIVTDATTDSTRQSYSLTINAGLQITTTSLPSWDVGITGYSQTVVSTGGAAPITWVSVGLPPGLTLSSSGVITGTPTSSSGSPYSVQLTATDALGQTAEQTISVAIYAGLAIATTGLPSWDVGVTGYGVPLSATGVIGTAAWSATGLPPGLTIESGSDAITGTPTSASGSPFEVTLTVTDTQGQRAEQSFLLTILTPVISDISSTSGAPGPVSFTIDGLVGSTQFDVFLDTSPGVISSSTSFDLGSCTSTTSGALVDCTVIIPSGLPSGTFYVDLFQDPSPPPFVLSVFDFQVAAHASASLFGVPLFDYEVAGGVLVAAGIAAAVILTQRRRRAPAKPEPAPPPKPRGPA